MFEPMRLVNARFSIFFDRNPEVRRYATPFEDRLSGQYGPPLVLPIPDELDPQVPRLVFSSTHGFSKILVSQISLVLEVNLSPDWQTDPERVRGYLSERSELLFELLALLPDAEARFSGVALLARLRSHAGHAEILSTMAQRLALSLGQDETLHDLELKKVRLCREDLYCNLTVRNYRIIAATPGETLQRAPESAVRERGVEILGDFNDRRAFNERDGYRSSAGVGREILSLAFAEMSEAVTTITGEA